MADVPSLYVKQHIVLILIAIFYRVVQKLGIKVCSLLSLDWEYSYFLEAEVSTV